MYPKFQLSVLSENGLCSATGGPSIAGVVPSVRYDGNGPKGSMTGMSLTAK